MEALGINGTEFYRPDALPVTQPRVLKETLNPTNDLTSSFLHPPPGFPTPVPYL